MLIMRFLQENGEKGGFYYKKEYVSRVPYSCKYVTVQVNDDKNFQKGLKTKFFSQLFWQYNFILLCFRSTVLK